MDLPLNSSHKVYTATYQPRATAAPRSPAPVASPVLTPHHHRHVSPTRSNATPMAAAPATASAIALSAATVHDRLMDTAYRLRESDRARKASLETRVLANEVELDRRQKEAEHIVRASATLAAERDELAFQTHRLRAGVETRDAELAQAHADSEQLRAQLVRITQELAHAEELSKQRATELAAASLAKAKLERQLQRAQGDINSTVSQSNANVDDAERRATNAIQKQRELRDAVQTTQDELAHVASRLQVSQHELSVAKESLSAAEEENKHLRAQAQALTVSNAELETRLHQSLDERALKTQQLLSDTDAQIQSLSATLSERTTAHSSTIAEKNALIESLSAQVNDLRAQIGIVAPTLVGKDETIADLKKEVKTRDAALVELRQELDGCRLELNALRTDAATHEADRRGLETSVARQQRFTTEREAQIKEYQQDLGRLRAEHSSMMEQLHNTLADRDATKRELDGKKAELAQYRDEVELLRIRNQEVSSAARDDAVTKEQLLVKVDRLNDQLSRQQWESQCAAEAAAAREKALKEDREYIVASHQAELEQANIRNRNREQLAEERHAAQVAALEAKLLSAETRITALQRVVDEAHATASRDAHLEKSATDQAIERRVAQLEQQHKTDMEEVNRHATARVEEARAEGARRLEALRVAHGTEKTAVEMERARERDAHSRSLEDLRDRNLRNEQLLEELRSKLRDSDALMQAAHDAHRAELTKQAEDHRRRELELRNDAARIEQAANSRSNQDRDFHRKKESEAQEALRDGEMRLQEKLAQERDASHKLTTKLTFLENALGRESRQRLNLLQDCEVMGRRLVSSLEANDLAALVNEGLAHRSSLLHTDHAATLDWASHVIQADEARGRSLIDMVASVGADALNIMTAYRCVREELKLSQQASPQRERVITELVEHNNELLERIQRLEGTVNNESTRRQRVEQHAETLEKSQRQLEETHEREKQQLSEAASKARVGLAKSQRDLIEAHEREKQELLDALEQASQVRAAVPSPPPRDEAVRALWNSYTLTAVARRHATAAFQLPSWRECLILGAIPDDLGTALCRMLEDVHTLFDENYKSVCCVLTDEEKQALGASPENFPAPPLVEALPRPSRTVQVAVQRHDDASPTTRGAPVHAFAHDADLVFAAAPAPSAALSPNRHHSSQVAALRARYASPQTPPPRGAVGPSSTVGLR